MRGRLQVIPCGTTARARRRTSPMEEGMADVVMPAVPRSCAADPPVFAPAVADGVVESILCIQIAASPSGMDIIRVC